MWEMCLSQKRKPKEEEERPTLHQSPPGRRGAPHPGYRPVTGMWIHPASPALAQPQERAAQMPKLFTAN